MLHCQVLTFVYMFTNHFVLNFIHSFTINCFTYCIVLFSHFPKNTKFPNTIVNTVYFNLLTNINPFLNILPSTLLFTFWICVKSKEGFFFVILGPTEAMGYLNLIFAQFDRAFFPFQFWNFKC